MARFVSILFALALTGASAFLPTTFNRALTAGSSTALNGRGDKRTRKGKISRGSNVSDPMNLKLGPAATQEPTA